MTDARADEQQFYSRYSWCLNPVLSVEDLLHRFLDEVDAFEGLSGWQQEESKANLYIFACAIACTADDYFALRWLDLKPLASRLGKLKPAIAAVQSISDAVQSTLKVQDRAAWRWRRRWDECVSAVCRLVIAQSGTAPDLFERIRSLGRELCAEFLPDGLLKRRMRLPEAFRSQDMAHQDVITLIERFRVSETAECAKKTGVVILGLRTAGAYFAALMTEYLKEQGFPDVSWFSIRPKNGVTRWEAEKISAVARENKHLLLVDDYPSTGHTFRLTLELLRTFGIRPDQVSVLAPTHPAQTRWVERAGIQPPVQVFTFTTAELYKAVSMQFSNVERLCREYFGNDCCVMQDLSTERINEQLAEHSKDGHHVREKRVFTIELHNASGESSSKKIFFKSAGWGWLGYHAYIAGTRLQGFVPEVIGFRNGLLLTEWMDGAQHSPVPAAEGMAGHIAHYIAARSRRLALNGDFHWGNRTYRWTGCDEISNILRGAYGPYVNRLKVPALRKQLTEVVTSVPTMTDGRMRPEEWLKTPAGTFKCDFEHHNFGGGELDIVDPAYDLAAAIHEFQLPKHAERELLQIYALESGDSFVQDRILLHKILYGTTAMRYAASAIKNGRDAGKNNERRLSARSFLVYSMNEFCAQFVPPAQTSAWSPLLFFMDLDGVFDHELLGFPHASRCGLQSVALLRAHGFSIVPNTGRSIQHVRQYCDAYGFPGGIAEFGSIFLDAVNGREVPLIDAAAAEQLSMCREAIRSLPGVFIDPAYEYSIRMFRYQGNGTAGLKRDEIKNLLNRPEFSKLTYVWRSADTYIVQKRTSKGAALRAVRRLVGRSDVPVTAIGDSQHDIGMLAAADFAYAPANCSPLVRELARRGKCRIVKRRYQNGLLAAVRDRLRKEPAGLGARLPGESPARKAGGLMECLLDAADRGPVPQFLSALLWWSL